MQTEPNKLFRFRSTWSGTDEHMIQLNAHASLANFLSGRIVDAASKTPLAVELPLQNASCRALRSEPPHRR